MTQIDAFTTMMGHEPVKISSKWDETLAPEWLCEKELFIQHIDLDADLTLYSEGLDDLLYEVPCEFVELAH